jgi:hypothetical protein
MIRNKAILGAATLAEVAAISNSAVGTITWTVDYQGNPLKTTEINDGNGTITQAWDSNDNGLVDMQRHIDTTTGQQIGPIDDGIGFADMVKDIWNGI